MSFSNQTLVLQPSRYHQGYIVALHLLAAGLLWLADVPRWSCVLLTLIALVAAVYQLLRYRQEFPCVLYCRDMGWVFVHKGHKKCVSLTGETWVTPWLTVLGVRSENGAHLRIALWPDSAITDDIRRVRVLLRNANS